MAKYIYCPANGWDCLYYKSKYDEETKEYVCGYCTLADPKADCDDFGYFYDEDEELEYYEVEE